MKRVVKGQELQDKMVEAIDLLCTTVAKTLGPKGSNVIIDHSNFSPFITNDGVTIAENIASEDPLINPILELAKEASLKTNENVGDGTTTTLVLLQSIFNEGLALVRNGENPLLLKKELEEESQKIVKLINELAHKPKEKELLNIAKVSANDDEIGQIIFETYHQILDKNGILIKEGNKSKTEVNYLNGYVIETNLASPYFLNGLLKLQYSKPSVLILNAPLRNLEEIAIVINKIVKEKIPLLIIATDYSENLINDVLSLNKEYQCQIILIKEPDYGLRGYQILEDLSIISGAKIVNSYLNLDLNVLGNLENCLINNEKTILSFQNTEAVVGYVKKLNHNLNNWEDKEFLEKRISLLQKGMAEILVGAKTVTERREKKMRYEDALNSIAYASLGVIPGSGLIFSQISSMLEVKNKSTIILKKALLKPLELIIKNAALDYEKIYSKIKSNSFNILYNVKENRYEKLTETSILDAKEVLINALNNAISIASMLLTTNCLIINEVNSVYSHPQEFNEF